MEGKTHEAVSSATKLYPKVSAITEKRDVFAEKCEELTLDAQCMPISSEKARSLRALVAKL